MSDLYIPTVDLTILLQEICGLILGIYKSLTDTWMWKLGLRPRNSPKVIHKWDLRCSALARDYCNNISLPVTNRLLVGCPLSTDHSKKRSNISLTFWPQALVLNNLFFQYTLLKTRIGLGPCHQRDCLMRQIKKFRQNLTELGLTKAQLVFKFLWCSNYIITQKVYLLRLMPVWVSLIMLAAYFCHSR